VDPHGGLSVVGCFLPDQIRVPIFWTCGFFFFPGSTPHIPHGPSRSSAPFLLTTPSPCLFFLNLRCVTPVHWKHVRFFLLLARPHLPFFEFAKFSYPSVVKKFFPFFFLLTFLGHFFPPPLMMFVYLAIFPYSCPLPPHVSSSGCLRSSSRIDPGLELAVIFPCPGRFLPHLGFFF